MRSRFKAETAASNRLWRRDAFSATLRAHFFVLATMCRANSSGVPGTTVAPRLFSASISS